MQTWSGEETETATKRNLFRVKPLQGNHRQDILLMLVPYPWE